MSPLFQAGDFLLKGSVTNNNSEFSLNSFWVQVLIIDCRQSPSSIASNGTKTCQDVSSSRRGVTLYVPPKQTRAFETADMWFVMTRGPAYPLRAAPTIRCLVNAPSAPSTWQQHLAECPTGRSFALWIKEVHAASPYWFFNLLYGRI
jgi:hypothetical protein